MSTILERVATLETTGVELVTPDFDEEGAPVYADSVNVQAYARKKDEVVQDRAGADVMTSLVLWYPASKTPVPTPDSRVTYDGDTYVVVLSKAVKGLGSGTLEHTKIICRDEGA